MVCPLLEPFHSPQGEGNPYFSPVAVTCPMYIVMSAQLRSWEPKDLPLVMDETNPGAWDTRHQHKVVGGRWLRNYPSFRIWLTAEQRGEPGFPIFQDGTVPSAKSWFCAALWALRILSPDSPLAGTRGWQTTPKYLPVTVTLRQTQNCGTYGAFLLASSTEARLGFRVIFYTHLS